MCQRVIALFGAPRASVVLEGLTCLLEVYQRHPEAARARVKMLSGRRIGVWISHQGQIVGQVRPLVIEASPLGRHRNAIGQPHWVAIMARLDSGSRGFQTVFHGKNCPRKGRRVAAVEDDGIEIVQAQMFHQPGCATLLRQGRALINTPSIVDHNRCHQTAVGRKPPARRPVTAALLLKGTVTQESH